MYDFLRGNLVSVATDSATIDVHGIGFRVCLPPGESTKFPLAGKELQVFTSFQVREDSQTLYGFLSSQRRDLFELLLSVSGIGPKLALNLLGHLTIEQLQQALQTQNIPLLSKVPGVGKKTAERLIVELRGKKEIFALWSGGSDASSMPQGFPLHDAISALTNLGLSPQSADQALQKAIKQLAVDADLSTIISTALRLHGAREK